MDDYDRGNEDLTDRLTTDGERGRTDQSGRDDSGGLLGAVKGAVENLTGGRTTEREGAARDEEPAPGVDRVGGGVDRDVGTPTGRSGVDDYREAVGGESTTGSDYRRGEEGDPRMTDRGFDSESTSY